MYVFWVFLGFLVGGLLTWVSAKVEAWSIGVKMRTMDQIEKAIDTYGAGGVLRCELVKFIGIIVATVGGGGMAIIGVFGG
jgi:hypothetical protein